jgi:endonuclease-3 related protein
MAAFDSPVARKLYDRLSATAGPRHWWPCHNAVANRRRDEIIIGAVLTQNTSWKNVEKALASLNGRGLLDLSRLATMTPEAIAPLIRSAGYFNLKARRLHAVAGFFAPGGRRRFGALAGWDDARLREALLATYGVGPETADSILLYALDRPTFVIDAYTLRIGRRHGLFDETTDYERARTWFMARVPADVATYNEYHALLVWVGHHYCKPTPRCAACPLARRDCCASGGAWSTIQARSGRGSPGPGGFRAVRRAGWARPMIGGVRARMGVHKDAGRGECDAADGDRSERGGVGGGVGRSGGPNRRRIR